VFASALLLGTSATAFAQGTVRPADQAADSAQIEVMLRERNRANMHPGNPLEIIGLEQGDNDLRSQTPALVNSDRSKVSVNADENYQRTLAMYESGAHFSQAAQSMPTAAEKPAHNAAKHVITTPEPAKDSRASQRWIAVIGLLTTLAGIAVLLWRHLSSERTNSTPV
jgi:hypothetical protein